MLWRRIIVGPRKILARRLSSQGSMYAVGCDSRSGFHASGLSSRGFGGNILDRLLVGGDVLEGVLADGQKSHETTSSVGNVTLQRHQAVDVGSGEINDFSTLIEGHRVAVLILCIPGIGQLL